MNKRLKPVLALILTMFMSVSTLSNTYTVSAEGEETVTTEQTTTEDVNEQEEVEDNNVNEEDSSNVEDVVPEQQVIEEQLGDASMMEYFLVDSPVVGNSETENFVLSLNNAEGYSDFSITVKKSDGSTFDLESSEQMDNLVKFSRVFGAEEKGEYWVTSLHYSLNGQKYYLNFSDLGMDVQFGVDQEYDGFDEDLPDMTEDVSEEEEELSNAVIQVTDVNNASEEVAEGMMAQDFPAAMALIDEDVDTQSNEGITLCLDPGHGGAESGTLNYNGTGLEKDYNLKIAKYCYEELQKYNCKVVMTRSTDKYMTLEERAEYAKQQGAQYLISIHLNASVSHQAYGAEVYYPNTNWRPDISEKGKVMAQAIQKQLVSLGLHNRGIKFRTIDINEYPNPHRYDDNSIADYYGVIRNAKTRGITGLIIEHCCMDNASDFNNYLGSEEKIKQLGVADANGIVAALGLTKKNQSTVNKPVNNDSPAQYRNVLADGVYTIQSVLNTNYVMDVNAGSMSNGGNIQLYANNGTPAQQFRVTHDSEGYVTFTNVKSGLALDLCSASTSNGSNIWQYESNNTKAQKWIVKQSGNGYVIVSALNPNYAIDLAAASVCNGSNIQLYESNGTPAQQWYFSKKVSKEDQLKSLASQYRNTLADGTYEVRSVKNSSYALDITSASTWSGANVQLYLANGTPAQAFKVTHDADGFVTFMNVKSQKVLDVSNGKAQNTQNVWQYASNGTRAQKWIVQPSGSGYKIVSALDPNYVLDLSNGFVRSGQNIQMYESNGTAAQQWTFSKFVSDRERCDSLASSNKSLLNDGTYYIKNQNVKYALDVANGSLYSGGNVWLYELNRTKAQQWILTHDSTGYVSFKNVGSGMYLTAAENGNFGNVNQQSQSNGYNQKWIVMFDQNHNLRITSALDSNLVIDVRSGSIRNTTNVQLYESNNTPAQKWVFEQIQTNTSTNTNPTNNLTQIMGTSQATVAQMVRYYNSKSSGYDTFNGANKKYNGTLAKGGAKTIEQFAQIVYEEARAEGVRAEVAFAQCMLETGFLKYGGDVLPNQYNFAGIGATGAVHGASFESVRVGVRAQVQHLKAYASLTGLTQQCVDPRFNLVTRGCAQYVEWLGMKENPKGYGWASAKNYGPNIVSMMNSILSK